MIFGFKSRFRCFNLFDDVIFQDLLVGIEKFCYVLFQYIFKFMKFVFVFIIFFIGILTLLRLRGVYLQQRSRSIKKEEDQLRKVRLILGTLYIFLGFGILFNYLIYFFIWIFNPLPDGLIFVIIDALKSHYQEYSLFEVSINILYPFLALVSFLVILYLFLSIYYLINNNRVTSNPAGVVRLLVKAVLMIIFFGFTTSFPYFL